MVDFRKIIKADTLTAERHGPPLFISAMVLFEVSNCIGFIHLNTAITLEFSISLPNSWLPRYASHVNWVVKCFDACQWLHRFQMFTGTRYR